MWHGFEGNMIDMLANRKVGGSGCSLVKEVKNLGYTISFTYLFSEKLRQYIFPLIFKILYLLGKVLLQILNSSNL